jgi:hypothetical protein
MPTIFLLFLALHFRLLYSDGSEAVAFLYHITNLRQLFASFFVFLFLNFHKTVKFKQIIVKFSLKRPTNPLGSMKIILLYSNHRHVFATHVAILRVLGTRTQIQL